MFCSPQQLLVVKSCRRPKGARSFAHWRSGEEMRQGRSGKGGSTVHRIAAGDLRARDRGGEDGEKWTKRPVLDASAHRFGPAGGMGSAVRSGAGHSRTGRRAAGQQTPRGAADRHARGPRTPDAGTKPAHARAHGACTGSAWARLSSRSHHQAPAQWSALVARVSPLARDARRRRTRFPGPLSLLVSSPAGLQPATRGAFDWAV